MPVKAYRVKHITCAPEYRDALSTIYPKILKRPYSVTDNLNLAEKIAREGSYIYVIETGMALGKRVYHLGYYFQAYDVQSTTSGAKIYMIYSAPKPLGMYLSPVVKISGLGDPWLRKPHVGMTEIPVKIVKEFDAMFSASGVSF